MCTIFIENAHTTTTTNSRERSFCFIFLLYPCTKKFSFLLSSSQDTSTKIFTENTNRMIRSVFQILIFSGSLIGVHCFNDFLVMGDWGGLPIWPYEDPAGIAASMKSRKTTGAYVLTSYIYHSFYTNSSFPKLATAIFNLYFMYSLETKTST